MISDLTKIEKAIIEHSIRNKINYLDGLLEENIKSILLEHKNLKLNKKEKRENAILLAKEVYYRG